MRYIALKCTYLHYTALHCIAMLGVFKHYIPKFTSSIKQKQLDIILNGFDEDNDVFFTTNVSLQDAVQEFIIQTKRFSSFT